MRMIAWRADGCSSHLGVSPGPSGQARVRRTELAEPLLRPPLPLLRYPAAVDGQWRSGHLVGRGRAEEDGEADDLLRRREVLRRRLLLDQFQPRRLIAPVLGLGAVIDLLLHKRRQHPAPLGKEPDRDGGWTYGSNPGEA